MKTKSILRLLSLIELTTVFTVVRVSCADLPPGIQWQRSIGGSADEGMVTLQQTSDGGLIVGGLSQSGVSGNRTSPGYGSYDFWVIKLNAAGGKIWENSFGGSGHDELRSLQQTSDGGFILGGLSGSDASGNKDSVNYGGRDYWVVKLNSFGDKVWEKAFGSSGDDELRVVKQTSDGGYVLGGGGYFGASGNKTNIGFGNSDFWLVKLDSGGEKLWERTFGGEGEDQLYSLQETDDGGYVLAGWSNSGVSGNKTSGNWGSYDYWIVKVDGNGDHVWDQSFGGDSAEYLWAVQQTGDGGYILGGGSQSYPSGNKTSAQFAGQFGTGTDYWVVRLDAAGKKLWDKSFGGDSSDTLTCLLQTEGGFLLGGLSASGVSGNKTGASLGSYDCWLLKVDMRGEKIWEKSLGGSDNDILYGLQSSSTGYFLAGTSASGISGNKTSANYGGDDFWIVKLEGPPRVVTQPQSLTVSLGDDVVFSVVAEGAPPLSYQWVFNGTNIQGATGRTLALTNTTHVQAGFYSVIVANGFGTAVSASAQLSFSFLTLTMYAGLTIDGRIGQTYRIEYVPMNGDLSDWRELATVTITNTPYLFIDRGSPKAARRFYRALLIE